MSRKIGYIDESGDKSIHFEKSGVTTFFVVTAIIIDSQNIIPLQNRFKEIAKKYTNAPEVKSNSKAFREIKKRINFLKELSNLDFKIYSIIVDKRKVFSDSGLQFRNSFFKYVNDLLDTELYNYYPYLKLVSDEHGDEKFMTGFIKYVENNHQQTELFRGPEFMFKNSKDEPLIQLADFIAGSIAKCYEPDKVVPESKEILNCLSNNILHLRECPETPLIFFKDVENEDEKYDQVLVNYIFTRINEFFKTNQKSTEIEIKNQLTCLHYLVYRFKRDPYSYEYSDQILRRINIRGVSITKRLFRRDIIGNLGDCGILITSSQNGYKIPCCKGDIIRFYNNYSTKVVPMIKTIGKTDIIVKSATSGNIDLLKKDEYKLLNELIKTTKASW